MPKDLRFDILIPGVRVPDGLEPDFADYSYYSLEQDFRSINAQSYIDRVRRLSGSGRLDVDATAALIPADLFIRKLGGPDHALLSIGQNDGRWKISFDECTPEPHKPFILGHEIGHIALLETAHAKGPAVLKAFMRRYEQDLSFHQKIEAVCEFFAGKLLSWIK